jgi:hypothetical protein
VVAKYGEIDDCLAIRGVWVIDTDGGRHGVGAIGIHVCRGPCENDVPAALMDWRFFHLSSAHGLAERVCALGDSGQVIFCGGLGEIHFDPATGKFLRGGIALN